MSDVVLMTSYQNIAPPYCKNSKQNSVKFLKNDFALFKLLSGVIIWPVYMKTVYSDIRGSFPFISGSKNADFSKKQSVKILIFTEKKILQ